MKPSRRQFLQTSAGLFTLSGSINPSPAADQAPPPPTTSLGLVLYCRAKKRELLRETKPDFDLFHPLAFLDECIRLGAGGMQADLGRLTPAEADSLHAKSTATKRFVEAIISMPMKDSDLGRFEANVAIAKRAGATIARSTIIPGRRYEQFDSLEAFRAAEQEGDAAIRRSLPVLEKHQMKLAIENHKDQRNEERLQLFERFDHEFVGACLDTGNSIALCEDPMETVKAFLPWALSVHLKDQAVQRIPEGFLLADIPLGQGCLELTKMIDLIKAAHDRIHFSLELITRDALVVPCLAESYLRVFRDLPARDLASMIRFIEGNAAKSLPVVNTLSTAQQATMEEENIVESLRFVEGIL